MFRYKSNQLKHVGLIGLMIVLISSCGKVQEGFDQDSLDNEAIRDYLTLQNIDASYHSSGVGFVISERGQGVSPVPGDTVIVNYAIYLLDGSIVNTNIEQLAIDNGIFSTNGYYEPFSYNMGRGEVIEGFEIATELLTENGRGAFYIPSRLAYGSSGTNEIPRNANLIVELELLEVKH